MQATFCINSLAHYVGDTTFSDDRTARDSQIVALISHGEGYHNFHHEFPYDYRNGIRCFHYDPGKWLIYLLSLIGFAYNLKRFPENEIEKGALQMTKKKVEQKMAKLHWGPDENQLPESTMFDVESRVQEGSSLIVIDGYVIDVAEFKTIHPGGSKILGVYMGKDATKAFQGEVYLHSNAAKNLMTRFRVGKIAPKKDPAKME